jgi:glycosyltransferase involved in cell wall biosynthesis
MRDVLVSVCCMAYNQLAFFRQCLSGILMQRTDFPFEIIIHDDASTDGTAEMIREYEREYPDIIRAIYQTENQLSKAGIYPIRFLYAAARGKYIAECDADDYWTDPLKLQKQVDFMEANPEYVMCYHAYQMLRDGVFSEPSTSPPRDYSEDELIAFQLSGYGIATNTKLYRNIFSLEERKYFNNFCPDYVLNVLMGMHGKCKFIPGIRPSVYRKHSGNTWSGTPGTTEKVRIMFQRLYDRVLETGNPHFIELRQGFLS